LPDLEVKSANNERYERYKIDSSVYRLFIYLFDFSYTGFELLISVWLARKLRKMKQKLVLKQTVQKKKVISDRYYHQLLLNPVLL
jgi:hypothetical protein